MAGVSEAASTSSTDRPSAATVGGPYAAFVLDTDGVITRTADVHAAAWKELFDAFLASREGPPQRPFDQDDYLRHVDGRPRYDGVATFLASRGIELERGDPTDPPTAETVCGLGNRKNVSFRDQIARHGVAVFAATVALVERARSLGVGVAAVSASENQAAVLEGAGVLDLFDVRVDGIMSRELGLAGKPDPALFLEAAARLGVEPGDAVVVEDAVSGVEAGRRGGFALVLGVDRGASPAALEQAGADVVVQELDQLVLTDDRYLRWKR